MRKVFLAPLLLSSGFSLYPQAFYSIHYWTNTSAMALGNQGTALTNPLISMEFNPAGLAFTRKPAISFFRNPNYDFTERNLSQ